MFLLNKFKFKAVSLQSNKKSVQNVQIKYTNELKKHY